MKNLCLPMRVINISQVSGGSYSHPNGALDLAGSDTGIDFAYALGNWKCVAFPWGSNTAFFVSCDETGKTCKVHCADGVDRIITMAMTHAEFKYVSRPYAGRVYKEGEPMYEEGRYSINPKVKITGNHIHFEVAEGVQTTKLYDKTMGVYRMKNELKPENVCFICDSFSTVANMHGLIMKHCATPDYQIAPVIPFAEGYQLLSYKDQGMHLYKMNKKEKIFIVAAPYGKVIDIADFKIPGTTPSVS